MLRVQALRQAIMTFTLVMVVYATAVTKPGHGNIAPLAIGFTLFASAFVGAADALLACPACPPQDDAPVHSNQPGPVLLGPQPGLRAGGPYTGAALNPARVLGPAMVLT